MIKTAISDYLLSYDCPMTYSGFAILCDLIKVAAANYLDLTTNLKSIYIEVGQQRKMTRLSIERDLRTLLDVWSRRPKFKELFPERPTNAQLIITLAHKLRYLNCSVYDTLLMP